LRAFSIQHLENAALNAIHRIQLAREFNLTAWEGLAYDELSKRDSALTDEEAQVLGVAALAKLARAREEEMLKKGKELGEQEHKEELKREQEEQARKEQEEKAKQEAAAKTKKEAVARRAANQKALRNAVAMLKRVAEEKAKRDFNSTAGY
jgi:hypothetical protein